jgi:hypothetical protein
MGDKETIKLVVVDSMRKRNMSETDQSSLTPVSYPDLLIFSPSV